MMATYDHAVNYNNGKQSDPMTLEDAVNEAETTLHGGVVVYIGDLS